MPGRLLAAILVLTFCSLLNLSVLGQRKSSRPKTKPTPATRKPVDEIQAKEQAELEAIENERTALLKLPLADKEKLRATITELQNEIRKIRLGDRLTKATRDLRLAGL